MKKMWRKSELVDSVKSNDKKIYYDGDHKRDLALLNRIEVEWENLRPFREKRARAARYVYGKQWEDVINVRGKAIRECEYIANQGLIPLTNNVIRKNVNTVCGLYTNMESEPICTCIDNEEAHISEAMTIILKSNWDANMMNEILATQFEEYLISGAAFARECYDYRNGRLDAWTDVCNPAYLFWNSSMKDPRHWDLNLIGEIHDLSFRDLAATFCKKPDDYKFLRDQYPLDCSSRSFVDLDRLHDVDHTGFYSPNDPDLCRVYEVWTQEVKGRYRCFDPLTGDLYKIEIEDLQGVKSENIKRIEQARRNSIPEDEVPLIEHTWFIDKYWYFRFITPQGYVLEEGNTPFFHQSHPYAIKLYPFVNGEVHSFVSDMIDQQRYINRMITLNDFMIRMTAKGVLLVPEDAIPDSMTPEDFAEQWTSIDGVIVYTPKPNVPAPVQIANKTTNIGTYEMIQLQINMLDMVSGVHGALQGQAPSAGTSARSYALQAQNASASLANLLKRYSDFTKELAKKKLSIIQQYYDEKRIQKIAGAKYADVVRNTEQDVKEIDFDINISESQTTPSAKARSNELLFELFKGGAITIEMLLENGTFPFGDALLQQIKSMKEQAKAGQQVDPNQAIDPAILQQIQQGADQQQVSQAQQLLQAPPSQSQEEG